MNFNEFLIESKIKDTLILEANFCIGDQKFKMKLNDNTTISAILKFLRCKVSFVCNMFIADFKVENETAILYIKCVMAGSQYKINDVLDELKEKARKSGINIKSIG